MKSCVLRPLLAAAAVLIVAVPGNVEAQTNLPLGSWELFLWNGTGPIDNPADGFFLDAVGPTLLRVVDCCITGDAFNVFINGLFAFATPPVAKDIQTDAFDGDSAWGDPRLSKGSIVLGPGQYLITIEVYDLPDCCQAGGGFIRADMHQQVVPEPMSMVLLGTGLAGIAFARRRRRPTL